MILFYFGNDTFRSRAHMRKTIAAFREKRDKDGFNTHIFNAENSTSTEIMQTLFTQSFLSEKKMIVIENCISSKNEALQTELLAAIHENKIQDDIVLLMYEASGELKGELFERLKQEKLSQEFIPFSKNECIGWMINEIKKGGVQASSLIASRIFDACGNDMYRLSNIIATLVAYTKSQKRNVIAPDDLSLFIEKPLDENTFHFVDACASGKQKEAIGLLSQLWMSQSAPLEILGALLWQWRTLISVASILEKSSNTKPAELSRQLKIHPFVAEKTSRMVASATLQKLITQYKELMSIEKEIKHGAPAQALTESFVLHCLK